MGMSTTDSWNAEEDPLDVGQAKRSEGKSNIRVDDGDQATECNWCQADNSPRKAMGSTAASTASATSRLNNTTIITKGIGINGWKA
jgi:hypothetical protein